MEEETKQRTLYLPAVLDDWLVGRAGAERRSINKQIVWELEQRRSVPAALREAALAREVRPDPRGGGR